MARASCPECGQSDHHAPGCPEMFFRGRDGQPDRTKPRGVPHPAETRRLSELHRLGRRG